MNKKIVGIFICILLVTTILPFTTLAGDPKNSKITNHLRKDIRLSFLPSFI